MSAVDNLFADMMKLPSLFGSNMFDRIFSTEPKEIEEVNFVRLSSEAKTNFRRALEAHFSSSKPIQYKQAVGDPQTQSPKTLSKRLLFTRLHIITNFLSFRIKSLPPKDYQVPYF